MKHYEQLVRRRAAACLAVCLASPAAAQVAGIAGAGAGVPVSIGRFEVFGSGNVDRIASPIRPRTALTFQAAVRAPIASGGLWLGSALEGSGESDSIPVRALLRGGAWQSFGAIRVSVDAAAHTARLGTAGVPRDSLSTDSSRSHVALWSDVEGQLSWHLSRATFSTVIGTRKRVDAFRPTVWSRVAVAYELTSHLALVGAAGTQPPLIALGVPAARFASVAVRVAPWRSPSPSFDMAPASAFVVRSLGSGGYAITYLAADASTVELSGDFGGWKPTAFTQARPGVWETTLAAGPGTYHVNVRVNGGAWFAPPGLPRSEDDFNGTVGILVLR